MKIRQGFVSNSSSSSFCIYGTQVDTADLYAALVAKGYLPSNEKVMNEDDEEENIEEDDYAMRDRIYEYAEAGEVSLWRKETPEEIDAKKDNFFFKTGLKLENVHSEDPYYIGKPWSSVPDDMTGKQFKDNIEKSITELLGKPANCGTEEYAWSDC